MEVTKILWGKGAENREEIPRIIWMYWEGKKSILVELCIQKIKKILPEYEVNILNSKTLRDFLPNIIEKNELLPVANYSDIIRLDLLRTYGGFWIDASMLLTENLDWVYRLKEDYHTDVIGFYADIITTNLDRPILETYFLAAPKNNKFINDWYDEFVKCYKSVVLPPPIKYYDNIKNDKTKLQGMRGLADYLIAYVSAMKIMLEKDDYRILMLKASESAHYYTYGLKVNHNQLWSIFLFDNNDVEYPSIIKFKASYRSFLDEMLDRGKLYKCSLLYKLSALSAKEYYKIKFVGFFENIKYIIGRILKK